MTRIKAPYIPAPRPNDKEYSELCRHLLDLREENRTLKHKLSSWQSYFAITAALLLICLVFIFMQHIEITIK